MRISASDKNTVRSIGQPYSVRSEVIHAQDQVCVFQVELPHDEKGVRKRLVADNQPSEPVNMRGRRRSRDPVKRGRWVPL
jgi:hypothetical protein